MKRVLPERLVPTLAALAALAVPAPPTQARAAEPLVEQSRLDRPGTGLAGIDLENATGLIHVEPSADGAVHLVAIKRVRGDSETRRRELAAGTRVEIDERDGRLRVRVRYPQRQRIEIGWWDLLRGRSVQFPDVDVQLSAQIPARVQVTLRSASGDIETEGLQGSQRLESASGDLVVSGARGPVVATTTSGDVRFEDGAKARLRTVSGDVVAHRASGPLHLRTTSGDVRVDDAADSLDVSSQSGTLVIGSAPRGIAASTVSGDLTLAGPTAGRIRLETTAGELDALLSAAVTAAELRTVSGALKVALSPGLRADLDLGTVSGQMDVAVSLDRAESGRTRLRGAVQGGGVPVILRSSSGDIDVVREGR